MLCMYVCMKVDAVYDYISTEVHHFYLYFTLECTAAVECCEDVCWLYEDT